MKTKPFFLQTLLKLVLTAAYALILVGGGGELIHAQTKDASAILQLDTTTQGFLPPRMTETQRDAIAAPATGLAVFNTNTDQLNVYDGTKWIKVGAVVDKDGDTQVQVEESADEDKIRFDVGGTEVLKMDGNGIVQEAWNTPTLLNGWVNYGSHYQAPRFFKDAMGTVHVEGLIRAGTDIDVFNLPVGYRPASTLILLAYSDNGAYRIDITSGGDFRLGTNYSSNWSSITVSFSTR